MPILINGVSVDCINHASRTYHVPAAIIVSVMQKENGKNGQANKNKNNTIDYGVLQINSIWLSTIAAYGYTKEDIQYNGCKNIEVGTWLLSRHMASNKPLWNSIANYHSKTPRYNTAYKNHIYKTYQKIGEIIRGV